MVCFSVCERNVLWSCVQSGTGRKEAEGGSAGEPPAGAGAALSDQLSEQRREDHSLRAQPAPPRKRAAPEQVRIQYAPKTPLSFFLHFSDLLWRKKKNRSNSVYSKCELEHSSSISIEIQTCVNIAKKCFYTGLQEMLQSLHGYLTTPQSGVLKAKVTLYTIYGNIWR